MSFETALRVFNRFSSRLIPDPDGSLGAGVGCWAVSASRFHPRGCSRSRNRAIARAGGTSAETGAPGRPGGLSFGSSLQTDDSALPLWRAPQSVGLLGQRGGGPNYPAYGAPHGRGGWHPGPAASGASAAQPPPTMPPRGRGQGSPHSLGLVAGDRGCQRGRSRRLGTKADRHFVPLLFGALPRSTGAGALAGLASPSSPPTSVPPQVWGTVPGSPFCRRPSSAGASHRGSARSGGEEEGYLEGNQGGVPRRGPAVGEQSEAKSRQR